MRSDYFAFRVSPKEKKIIAQMANRMRRTQSDAVRLVILTAAADLGIFPDQSFFPEHIPGLSKKEAKIEPELVT